MPAIPSSEDSWLIRLNYLLAEATYWGGKILYSLFLVGIFLSVGRMVLVGILAYIQKRKEKKEIPILFHDEPGVSVIVPAYNEELNAVATIRSLLNQEYKKFDIIFVDDGSKDKTFDVVEQAFRGNPKVKVLSKLNGGKAQR
jgi:cellulose synthase/poly-beta-1,6-N-acetylglucosamine synthase-like glycosyltransferase